MQIYFTPTPETIKKMEQIAKLREKHHLTFKQIAQLVKHSRVYTHTLYLKWKQGGGSL